MNWPRRTVIGVTVAVLAMGLGRVVTSRAPSLQAVVDESPLGTARTATRYAVAPRLDRLRAHVSSAIAPVASIAPGRNLFKFALAADVTASPVPSNDRVAPRQAVPLPVRTAPSMTLIGVAREGDERTAIVAAAGGLEFVRVGEVIRVEAHGYRVAIIGDDHAELADTLDGSRVQLLLK